MNGYISFLLGLSISYFSKHFNFEAPLFYIPGYCKLMYAHKPSFANISKDKYYTTCSQCGFIKRYK